MLCVAFKNCTNNTYKTWNYQALWEVEWFLGASSTSSLGGSFSTSSLGGSSSTSSLGGSSSTLSLGGSSSSLGGSSSVKEGPSSQWVLLHALCHPGAASGSVSGRISLSQLSQRLSCGVVVETQLIRAVTLGSQTSTSAGHVQCAGSKQLNVCGIGMWQSDR